MRLAAPSGKGEALSGNHRTLAGERFRQMGEEDRPRAAACPRSARITDKMPLNFLHVGSFADAAECPISQTAL